MMCLGRYTRGIFSGGIRYIESGCEPADYILNKIKPAPDKMLFIIGGNTTYIGQSTADYTQIKYRIVSFFPFVWHKIFLSKS